MTPAAKPKTEPETPEPEPDEPRPDAPGGTDWASFVNRDRTQDEPQAG